RALAAHQVDEVLAEGVREEVRRLRRGEGDEVARRELDALAVDAGHGAALEHVDPLLLDGVRMVRERLAPRRDARPADGGALEAREPAEPGAAELRAGVEALGEGTFGAVLVGRAEDDGASVGHGGQATDGGRARLAQDCCPLSPPGRARILPVVAYATTPAMAGDDVAA